MEENYYNEIEHIIKRHEINRRARVIEDNNDTLRTNWEIGKFIVEAQGGETRSKYGNGFIKEWSKKLTKIYGNNYSERNLRYFRQFYNLFPIWQPVVSKLSWSHFIQLLPIKDENKRNYYINLCIERNLSKRELINEIKDNSYERLLERPVQIKIMTKDEDKVYNVKAHIKNPILIKLDSNDNILKEKDLQLKILSKLKNFFEELGMGYAFIGNEYKIKFGNKNYFIDILLFNVEMNFYVVVELKMRELRREDKSQIEFYMKLVDDNLKRSFHNNTIGIIVSKEQDKFIATFVSENNIIPITYLLKE